MAAVQEGVQVLFDQIEASDASSDGSTDTTAEEPRNYHQEQFPNYVPPHKRGHNTGQDKFVNVKPGKAGEKDKQMGVDHESYQRLMLPVPFALDKGKMARLRGQFPGVFFHCRDNGNHDHPYSHLVTMIGTRLMQRRIKPGSRILDVYGNPNASDRFNTSQVNAEQPKFMKALVNKFGPSDFVREVNKWGPFFDEDTGEERYHRGTLESLVNSGEIAQYDVLHLTHTLYYISMQQLADALHAPGKKRVAYALVHKHSADKGTINDGEQEYTKKWVQGRRLVRQVNVSTGSAYVHPDLTGLLFQERKVWTPAFEEASRTNAERQNPKGLAWDLHVVNDDTWIVQIVPYEESTATGFEDYAQMWNDDDMLSLDDPLTTPSVSSDTSKIRQTATSVVIPSPDGRFVELDIPCIELYNKLRARASGKARTAKLLEELIATAQHLTDPSALFGNATGLRCPPEKIFDVAVAAMTADVPNETLIFDGIACLKPVLTEHARGLKLGPKFKDMGFGDMLTALRTALIGMRQLNKVIKSTDVVDEGLGLLQHYTD